MPAHLCPVKDYLKNPAISYASLNTSTCRWKKAQNIKDVRRKKNADIYLFWNTIAKK